VQRFITARQRLYQDDQHSVAHSLSKLAVTMRALGEHEQAQELDEQALAMRIRLAEL
jgi:hypothetical protein